MATNEPQDLAGIAARTFEDYNGRADQFWEGTRDHDVRQNVDAFLQFIEGDAPFTLLDFGCGPGRDLKTLTERGHTAIGLDGTPKFVEMARANSGCDVWHQDFFNLTLPDRHFDGVFANASLFHVPRAILPRVLSELHDTLKPRGVLFASNPRGHNEEGWRSGRYGAFHDLENWRAMVQTAGFTELLHYYRPAGLPIEQQPWLATVWRRLD